MIRKKAVGPIVATALLLVVAVVGVVTFQTWFNTYSSSLQNQVGSQSTEGLNTRVENVVGDSLYFRNGENENISIERIVIGGQDCNISQNVSSGVNNLDLGNCTSSVNESITDVVVYTNKGIYSHKMYLDSVSSSDTGNSFSLDCNSLPGEWSAVPGNDDLNTSDFCVMTYEAKATTSSEPNLYDPSKMYCGDSTLGSGNQCKTDNRVNVTSKAESFPLTRVYQNQARTLCEKLGPNFSLISDKQWVTIARNVEKQAQNWADGVIGSTISNGGGLKIGNDGINNSAAYNGSDPVDRSIDSNNKAKLTLSTGDDLWDFSGNVIEWTNDTTNDADLGTGSTGWSEWTSISGHDYLESTNHSYNSSYGIGKVYTKTTSPRALLRGGNWFAGNYGGIYSLDLDLPSGRSYRFIGFRCTYS